MPTTAADLWVLIQRQVQIDPDELASAIERQAADPHPDYRTRLLIRDSIQVLRSSWSDSRLNEWLSSSSSGPAIQLACRDVHSPPGFPSLKGRVVNTLKRETLEQFLRSVAFQPSHPQPVIIGGAAALILACDFSRQTEDVDLVDEVPPEIRADHTLLDELQHRFGLRLTHFQSHYLPPGWQSRIRSLGRYGDLLVSIVDAHDIFTGKLFSSRAKDRDDLRILYGQLDRSILESRAKEALPVLGATAQSRQTAEANWYTLTGKSLSN